MIVIKDLQKVHGQDLFAAFVEVVSGRTDVSHVELNLGIKDPLVPETTTVRKVVGLYISEEVWEKVIKPSSPSPPVANPLWNSISNLVARFAVAPGNGM